MWYCRRLLKAMIILLPLLGLTWIIGILAVNNDTQVFAWIFAILNSLQVILILSLYIIRYVYAFILIILGCLHIYISCAEE